MSESKSHFVTCGFPHSLGLSVELRFQKFFPELRWDGGGHLYNIGNFSIKIIA